MKKIIVITAMAAALLTALLCSCNYNTASAFGNYAMLDTKYHFDYAMIAFPDGTTETVEIRNWMDFEGEQIQITDVMGNTYVVNSVNCVLVAETREE